MNSMLHSNPKTSNQAFPVISLYSCNASEPLPEISGDSGASRSSRSPHGAPRSPAEPCGARGASRSLAEPRGAPRSLAEPRGASRSLAESPETPEITGISGVHRRTPETTGTHTEHLLVPPPRYQVIHSIFVHHLSC